MKIKVLKGTNQIGGCITEIISSEAKIIIDFGEDLPSSEKTDKNTSPIIEGLTVGNPKYDAVFITHSHGDHIGLINNILEEIPVFVEPISKKIFELLNDFTKKENIRQTIPMYFEKTIEIKDMKITPFIIDHSSYNSSMILIESNGKRILHTGDYRNHGYKGKIFEQTLKKIGKIDCLITEGTALGRNSNDNITENELSIQSLEIFKKYNQVLVLQSSTNIDRITSFYKASTKTNKNFIEDLFTATITSNISNKIPNPINFNNVFVWIPLKYRKKDNDFKEKYLLPMKKYSKSSSVYKDYTMLVKTSMIDDIKLLYKKNKLNSACLIYSMWDGYLEKEESFKIFVGKIKELNIDVINLHTSGHADIKTCQRLEEMLNPYRTVVIHTNNKNKINNVFKKAIVIKDNDEMEV